MVKNLIVGITGASGVTYGIKLLEILKPKIKTTLLVTRFAWFNIETELGLNKEHITSLADNVCDINDLTATISSGSTRTDGMVIIPCSMKTLSGIANGYSNNLLLRAADVTIKEKRPLVLVLRETPLNIIHIENMLRAARAGAIILPAMPAFYHHPKTVDDIVNFVVGKVLDILQIEHNLYQRWKS